MTQPNELHTINWIIENRIARITLSRPEVHNAFNDIMINELLSAYQEIAINKDVRVVVITGKGQSFCAGADLNWMKRVKDYSYEQNLNEALNLAELFYTMYTMPQPTIAKVNGAAIGGGTGLVAVNDIVIASEKATFSLSEVKLGLVPACISPYVLRRVGERGCRELFLTGERIDAHRAKEFGLANAVAKEEELDQVVDQKIKLLLTSGPQAISICKELLQKVPSMSYDQFKRYTAEVIAKLRISDEGQEGMNAFLEKRKPKWSHYD